MNHFHIKILSLSLLLLLLLSYCGKSPSDPPAIPTGSLRIAAWIDTNLVDSMAVQLDNHDLGMFPNPCVLSDLVSGRHQVALSKKDPADSLVDFNCSPKIVKINSNDTTKIELLLTKLAPDFTLENLNHEQRVLQDFRGKVVFLVFFSYT